MGNEYRAKVFKSGNSVALRLPKALGLQAGQEMILRESPDGLALEPLRNAPRKLDLSDVFGAIPGLQRPLFDQVERAWPEARGDD